MSDLLAAAEAEALREFPNTGDGHVDSFRAVYRSIYIQGVEWVLAKLDRETLRDELSGWPIGSGYYQTTVTPDEARDMADAVLALLGGND